MTADIARTSYDPSRPWRAVIPQQGRVTLEADINEQTAIAAENLRQETIELVGPVAIPRPADGSAPGYQVTLVNNGADVSISPGAIYVGGWRVSLAEALASQQQTASNWRDMPAWPQPTWPNQAAGSLPEGNVIVALLLIEQAAVAVEDQALLEVALGGPDSAGRLALLQHVLLIPTNVGSFSYANSYLGNEPNPLQEYLQGQGGFYSASQGFTYDPATAMLTSTAALQVVAPSNYAGPDNQMIRVALSSYDGVSTGSLVWGFDNASFLYRTQPAGTAGTFTAGQPISLTFLNPPIDPDHQPQPGQAVEILRCTLSLDGATPSVNGNYIAAGAGLVVPLSAGVSYDPVLMQLTLPLGLPQFIVNDLNDGLPVFVRLWQAQIQFSNGTTVALGTTGISVVLTLPAGFPVLPGQLGTLPFWQFAVRTSTPQQVYPERYLNAPQPPDGPRQAMAMLAIAQWSGSAFSSVNGCSQQFLSVSQLTPPLAAPPALHVTGINWVNDDLMTLDWLIYQGLTVTLDNPPSGPIDSRNFLVTLRVPQGGTAQVPPPLPMAGTVTVQGNALIWQLAPPGVGQGMAEQALLSELQNAYFASGLPVEARVTLKGHAIFGSVLAQSAWLDGQCFGIKGNTPRTDGSGPRIDLNLSNNVASGNGAKASDFESWFQLAPPPTSTFTISPPSVQLVEGVAAPSIQGTVSLSPLYADPASAGITVSLSSSDAGSASTQSSVVLALGPNGTTSPGTFPVSIVSLPGSGGSSTVTFRAGVQLPSTWAITSLANLTVIVPSLTLNITNQSLDLEIFGAGIVNGFSVSSSVTLSPLWPQATVLLSATNGQLVSYPSSIMFDNGSSIQKFNLVFGGTKLTPGTYPVVITASVQLSNGPLVAAATVSVILF